MRREGWKGRLTGATAAEPFKAYILTAPQMAAHGTSLARQHRLAPRQRPDALLTRLSANARVLQEVNAALAATVVAAKPITPAGEWLLDNLYLIEEEIRLARRLMPLGYSRALPQLQGGVSDGLPRVYDLALQVIAHSDSCIDSRSLSGFIDAYQRVAPLKLGELWAIPIMLRLALIENLRRVGARIAEANADRRLANRWADAMQEVAKTEPAGLILLVADMARSGAPMTSAFVAEFARRLQANPAILGLPLTWVEQHLASSNQTIDELVQVEIAGQAAAQLTVSNGVNSLRLLDSLDWPEFVETLSVVEHELHADPSGVYALMDFATRDAYRHVVERLARLGSHSEQDVARTAVALAHEAGARQPQGTDQRRQHVGYYLIDRGLPRLERALALHLPWSLRLRRDIARTSLAAYLGSIALISAAAAFVLFMLGGFAAVPLAVQITLGALCLLAASHLAVGVVNWAVTVLVAPQRLPRMDYATGIPQPQRTLVVVPTLLDSIAGLESLIESLEVRFLGNRDPALHFALLTDFRDAASEHMPGDTELLELARERIEQLNDKYPSETPGGIVHNSFFLLHRPRCWNAQEGAWMGYERKRGKLAELNALLRSVPGAMQRFSLIVGDTSLLGNVRYVITLDTDTRLPRGAAREMTAAMAHPLNQPRFRRAREGDAPIVVEGYGILQPRVEATLSGAVRSRHGWLFGGPTGIDPYTRAVSDVYQDLFGEGSFIGKGVYDVDALERVLADRLPENRILSHDLLEGCFTRSGLLSDVSLYEDHPASYAADVGRRHRWTRGDWQLLPWVLPWLRKRSAAMASARWRRNPLSALSRWKLFDNLRRSLVPASLIILAAAAWWLSETPLAATLALLGVLLVPVLAVWTRAAVRRPPETSWRLHLAPQAPTIGRGLLEYAFRIASLPHEAYWQLDAIVRSLWRMSISGRRLLEWMPSSDLDDGRARVAMFQRTWVAPLLAVASAIALGVVHSSALLAATPVLLAWLGLPMFIRWLDRPPTQPIAALERDETLLLRALARRTWGFFERFVGPQDHWLPPDNHQEQPIARTAHRTSPTNIGMALLANFAAYDFGYLLGGELLDRCGNTLDTMLRLPRHRGHFYNWYDTRTLEPLRPAYVSTVDSGNLAGFLVTLAGGLEELAQAPIFDARWFTGLADTRRLLREAGDGGDAQALVAFDAALERACATPPTMLAAVWRCVDELAARARALQPVVDGEHAASTDEAVPDEAAYWIAALIRQSSHAREELTYLMPLTSEWTSEPQPDSAADMTVPTLQQLADGVIGSVQDEAVRTRARQRLDEIEQRIAQVRSMARMDHRFLYDESRKLLTIGYNTDEHQRDDGCFDLLASEARLGHFVAIAQGQIPVQSWFSLGRSMVTAAGQPALASWSGSMFEYLMPMLVMPSYRGSLLEHSCQAAVARQIEYGRQRGAPWGISESGFYGFDAEFNYQYRPFGVPGLGLKRGLAADLVVAPYASVMALMIAPHAAIANLKRLAREGVAGRYGFHEAIDYTAERLPHGARSALVRSFMAHHQGMSLLALLWRLLDQPMQRRFASDPETQATLLLLQERMPQPRRDKPLAGDEPELLRARFSAPAPTRIITSVDTPQPEVQLLSNGRYHVMVTHAGGGYSRWLGLAVTRWQEDATRDPWGSFCYIRDVRSGRYWSIAHQPTGVAPLRAQAIFTEGRVEFRRRDTVDAQDAGIDTHTEIVVSQEDDIELRRVRITNLARTTREIDITSYAEVVLAPPASDASHPAFSKLFVQTEQLERPAAILCTRRPRVSGERSPWMFHLMVAREIDTATVSYETDRAAFIGRGNSVAAPSAMRQRGPLGGGLGSVLDPIAAARGEFVLAPGATVTIDLVTGVADSREACIALALRYQDRALADRVFDMAWTHGQVVLRQLNASEADAQLYARLAGAILYANARLRAEAAVLLTNRHGQSGLWGHSISGDLPIVLLRIGSIANLELVRQLVQAHAWWRLKGLAVDLVIWNEDNDVYRQQLHEQILGLVSGLAGHPVERPGGIFVRHIEHMPHHDRVLLQSVARVIVSDRKGTLVDQLEQAFAPRAPVSPVPRAPVTGLVRALAPARISTARRVEPSDLQLFNGIGGFSTDGREYVIAPIDDQPTPAPWSNVLANPRFGSVVSDTGSAYTWFENAHGWRLTPWRNDPVTDDSGEAIFLRDEDNGRAWSPTGAPLAGRGAAARPITRHGFGYSVFEHIEDGVASELTVFVAIDDPIKFWRLRVRNHSGRARRLSAIGYVEWVLGDLPADTAMHVTTEIDRDSGAVLARNRYHPEFGAWVAFFDSAAPQRSVTADRTEFIGRHRSLRNPTALGRAALSGRVGAGLDPCAAIMTPFEIADGEEHEIVFQLGAGRQLQEARELLRRFAMPNAIDEALDAVNRYWAQTLGMVQVRTPEPALDLLVNGWLVYQTLACRYWARSGYYQSSGAYGFRDQLQDTMALLHAEPQMLRKHLLRSAGRQFVEGDVQHWWHPPSGRGVRTQCSDDYLWLPLALCRYVEGTGDVSVLDEVVPFLEGPPVPPGEESWFDLPTISTQSATLYQHAVRAIEHGLRFGAHGLPLMGGGDWNDGMNLVGLQGRGESVWLGFFLCEVLRQFEALAQSRDDIAFAERCKREREQLAHNLDQHGWDGGWWRRAYFDDGTPLGSASNVECQIDSIAQSWSVLSGVGSPERTGLAMEALDTRLVRREQGLVQLLDPPFDTAEPNPGYIRSYVPGVRENGGQYTHAAIWAAMAFAAQHDHGRAWELWGMIQPIGHARNPQEAARYKVEPYVVSADVYSVAPHTGRGGWSWYTGSAGWLLRLALESLLGLRRVANQLYFEPCLPPAWQSFSLLYRQGATSWHITVTQHDAPQQASLTLDGVLQQSTTIELVDDGREHEVQLALPRAT